MKSHYDVLGVPVTATQEQIVTAYRLRSKVLHPDRFDPTKQRVEWELANELVKELNASYAVLRDPANRAAYDRAIGVSATSSPVRFSAHGGHVNSPASAPSPGPTRTSSSGTTGTTKDDGRPKSELTVQRGTCSPMAARTLWNAAHHEQPSPA